MKGIIGVENNGVAILVMHIPERKKPVLAVRINGNENYSVATFTSEGRADWFLTMMQDFFGQKLQ